MKDRLDYNCYKIGKWIWLPGVVLGMTLSYFLFDKYMVNDIRFLCLFKRITGYPCPGCGGTRAFVYLFRGEIVKSFIFHPVVCYIVASYLHFMILYQLRLKVFKNIDKKEIKVEYYLYVMIFVILLQWLIKIIMKILDLSVLW